VVAAGLVLSAAYSLRPVRVADRGAAASLLLPAGYVAVPYLVGVLGARGSVAPRDLALLGGLYLGFIGRIVLKDFRDVRGDALFGKRTFLVRHGRRRTCAFSAACWTAGAVTLAAVKAPAPTLMAAWAAYLAVALWLLRALSVERGWRRDEVLISAIAIVGRGMMVTLLAHYSMTAAGWSAPTYLGVMVALVAIALGQARTMARRGGSVLVGRHLGEQLQHAAPASALDGDGVVDHLAVDQPVQQPVLQLDRGLLRSVGGEAHLDLAGVVGVGVELPLAVDLPGDHQPVRRLPGQHAAPVALAAVDAPLVPAPALARLQDRRGHLRLADVVVGRPPGVHRVGEDPERAVDRHTDGRPPADVRDRGGGVHPCSCSGSMGAASAAF
jgi:hypothetical protein